jgi:hypothetical protein
VYLKSQEAIRRDRGHANLSVYRLMVGPQLETHVVVLGDTPNTKLFEELQRFLATGESVELREDVLVHLMGRRAASAPGRRAVRRCAALPRRTRAPESLFCTGVRRHNTGLLLLGTPPALAHGVAQERATIMRHSAQGDPGRSRLPPRSSRAEHCPGGIFRGRDARLARPPSAREYPLPSMVSFSS